MKELIGKSGIDKSSFPQKIIIDKTETVGETKIANEFNKFFIKIGPKLAQKIPQPLKRFESYMNRVNSEIENNPITVNQLKKAFYFLRNNKSAGYGNISHNVVKNCVGELCDPLFNLSSSSEICPDSWKIGKVTPIYKANDSSDLGNYRPISAVLPCFSKILERIIYNRGYYKKIKLFTVNNLVPSRALYRSCYHSFVRSNL